MQGILIGQNLKKPRIYYIKKMIDLDIGDLVVTSGKGGIFPSEIPIGILASKNITRSAGLPKDLICKHRCGKQQTRKMERCDYIFSQGA